MIYISFLLVVFLLLCLFKIYGFGSAIHPGAWYSVAWLFAILAYWALDAVGGVPVYSPDDLEQLMVLVSFTAAAFLFFVFFWRANSNKRLSHMPTQFFIKSAGPYQIFSCIGFVGAIANWIALGANFGYDDSIRQQWLTEIPRVTAITWYLYFLSYPAAIIAGRFYFSELLQGYSIFRWRLLYWMLPAISGLFWSLSTGGRQALGILLFHFVVGAAFGLGWAVRSGFKFPRKIAFKLVFVFFLIVLTFSLFVGLSGLSRAKQQGIGSSSFDEIWYLAPVGQFISYMGLSIATHQAYGEPIQRDLSETGPVSLAGLQDFGLRYITGWRPVTVDDTNPERALASSGLDLASGTRNVFYDFQADFGFAGAVIASLVLVFISHFLFIHSQFLKGNRLAVASPMAIMIMFWGYSHQFSLLMFNTFFWLALSCLLWDVALRLHRWR